MPINRAADRIPQPWKNGLGVQYEIACDGLLPDDWAWRLSTADITQDVPFSVFPGVHREFCVADGNGVVLNINGVNHRCEPGSITRFRGDDKVHATLIDGPVSALNLMLRDGTALKQLRIVNAGEDIGANIVLAGVAILGSAQVVAGSQTFSMALLDAILEPRFILSAGGMAILC